MHYVQVMAVSFHMRFVHGAPWQHFELMPNTRTRRARHKHTLAWPAAIYYESFELVGSIIS